MDVSMIWPRRKHFTRLFVPKYIVGAPDFVVEVLSLSTARKDRYLKLFKYAMAGVREYWIVDLKRRTIIVNDFEEDTISLYSFRDKVPVNIYGGKCQVDFAAIDDYLTYWFEEEE